MSYPTPYLLLPTVTVHDSCRYQSQIDIFRFVLKQLTLIASILIMVFYPAIGSTYFVKTQTYVALFGPHQLSIIFSGVMYLELSSL